MAVRVGMPFSVYYIKFSTKLNSWNWDFVYDKHTYSTWLAAYSVEYVPIYVSTYSCILYYGKKVQVRTLA